MSCYASVGGVPLKDAVSTGCKTSLWFYAGLAVALVAAGGKKLYQRRKARREAGR